jgi:hypothetical protein
MEFNNPKREIERLSKENFNLKLRLHYFEQEQGLNGGGDFDDNDSSRRRHEEEERQINYRLLLEEAKSIVAGLKEDLNSSRQREERLDAENHRLKSDLERIQHQLASEEQRRFSIEEELRRQKNDYETALARAHTDRVGEVTNMREQLRSEQEIRYRAESDAKSLRAEVEFLESEKRTGAWQSVTIQNQLAKAEEESRHWQQQFERLENEKRKGEWQSSNNSKDMAKLEADARHWRYEAEKLEAEKRRGDWRSSSALELSRAEEEARKWRLEAERLESEKRKGGWEQIAASELSRAEDEARRWKNEAEKLERELARSTLTSRVTPQGNDESLKWQTFAESVVGEPTDLASFAAYIRSLERQAKRKTDDARTWEVFTESLTGARTIESLEVYITDLQGRFERLAKRIESQQQKKPASLQRVQQAEEKLRAATERLERLEGSRKGKLDEYIQRITELEDENRRLLRELTDLKLPRTTSLLIAPPSIRREPLLSQLPTKRRNSHQLDDVPFNGFSTYSSNPPRRDGR